VCSEPVLLGAPAYKCSVSECSGFIIHKSCAKLSHEINHPLHPHHIYPFSLVELSLMNVVMLVVHLMIALYFTLVIRVISNSTSNVLIIIACQLILVTVTNMNSSPFGSGGSISIAKLVVVERKLIKGITDLCSIFQLLVHKKCAEIPRTIKIVLHNHFLNLIYSPHEINKCDNMFCRIGGNKVNTKYVAYNCEECSYHVHTECLRLSWDMYKKESLATSESVPNNSPERSTHLIKALNQAEDKGPHPEEIKHFSHDDHQLKLILCDDEVKDGKLCEGCTDFIISAPFYSYAQCQFFLQTRCAELPTTIEQYRFLYFCTLTLLPRAPTNSGVFFCNIQFSSSSWLHLQLS